MLKKRQYSPVKLAIIIGIGFIVFLIFGILYRRSSYTEIWLVCEYPNIYETYEETLKFRYKENKLYGYYREEIFYRDNESDLEEQYKYFSDIADDLEMNDNFSYDILKSNGSVSVKTYIGVSVLPQFFNNYMKDKEITNENTLEEIKENLESSNYSCKVSYK